MVIHLPRAAFILVFSVARTRPFILNGVTSLHARSGGGISRLIRLDTFNLNTAAINRINRLPISDSYDHECGNIFSTH